MKKLSYLKKQWDKLDNKMWIFVDQDYSIRKNSVKNPRMIIAPNKPSSGIDKYHIWVNPNFFEFVKMCNFNPPRVKLIYGLRYFKRSTIIDKILHFISIRATYLFKGYINER